MSELLFPQSAALSPTGRVHLASSWQDEKVDIKIGKRLKVAFSKGSGSGILHLGLREVDSKLNPSLSFWRELGQLFLKQVCTIPEAEKLTKKLNVDIPQSEIENLVFSAPPMLGSEYVTYQVLVDIWKQVNEALEVEIKASDDSLKDFLQQKSSVWNLMGRVCFHLAENKGSEETPFAFLATYTHSVSGKGSVQHLPLGNALEEYAGAKNKQQLLALLAPVQKAASKNSFINEVVESREIFHPQAWTPQEAHIFLKGVPVYEESGIVVRVPDWWKVKNPPRPQMSITVGNNKSQGVGLNALLDFSADLTLNGEKLSASEIRNILAASDGLALIRGKWVEIDKEKLKEVLDHWKSAEETLANGGLSFIEGMRLLSGAGISPEEEADAVTSSDWASVSMGQWLNETLENIKHPEGKLKNEAKWKKVLKHELRGELRPYQWSGVKWLRLLSELNIGACLADDMGLGKTIQILSLFLLLKEQKLGGGSAGPFLLIVPASLLGNWKNEADQFSPNLRMWIAHPSAASVGLTAKEALNPTKKQLKDIDVILVTYGSARKLEWLKDRKWSTIVLDEAQAIKNPSSQQTKVIKSLKSNHRIVLTGTPIENHLSDLWSLFDFICPGLLGSYKQFQKFVKPPKASKKSSEEEISKKIYSSLRKLVQPYILRRLKSDKTIISDLPDKTELQVYCSLTKKQAAIYQDSVSSLTEALENAEGIQRRGLVLAYLMRFKQICNHPSQWLRNGAYDPVDSGKFQRLRELAETILEKQEKLLVFTQFKELTGVLSQFLEDIFGEQGIVLHGQTAIKKRRELVAQFQAEGGPPFFVLSLKAGGTGLNLTAASHVIHFDRWWNPAVENQATDRAYRIGQKKNVLVHKFVCQGTIEEKIDKLIESKQSMSEEILGGSSEAVLTELSNEELLDMVTLDLNKAVNRS